MTLPKYKDMFCLLSVIRATDAKKTHPASETTVERASGTEKDFLL